MASFANSRSSRVARAGVTVRKGNNRDLSKDRLKLLNEAACDWNAAEAPKTPRPQEAGHPLKWLLGCGAREPGSRELKQASAIDRIILGQVHGGLDLAHKLAKEAVEGSLYMPELPQKALVTGIDLAWPDVDKFVLDFVALA